MPLLRKLLTKPVWLWERYVAARRVAPPPFAPLRVNVARPLIVIQTTPKTFNNSLWTACSLMMHTRKSFGLMIVLDAERWPSAWAAQAQKLFPGVSLRTTHEVMSDIPASTPSLLKYAHAHPLGRKLATIFTLNQNQPIIFSDDDILAFAPLEELAAWGAHPAQAWILTEEKTGIDPVLEKRAQAMSLKAPKHFNSGLMALPEGYLSPERAEKLMDGIPPASLSWFAETTVLAHQLAEATPLPGDTYIVNCQRQFFFETDVDYGKIKLRHFVGPVRHLFRLRGVPAFTHSCKLTPSSP